jgi:hypothetical protein
MAWCWFGSSGSPVEATRVMPCCANTRGGIGARVGNVLFHAPADVLRLCLGVERFLLRLFQVVPQRIERFIDTRLLFGGISGFVDRVGGHAIEFFGDGVILRTRFLLFDHCFCVVIR